MSFFQTWVIYFRPNRSLEYYYQINTGMTFSIYNFEGIHFRLFQSPEELEEFFINGDEPVMDFTDENELDRYLKDHY